MDVASEGQPVIKEEQRTSESVEVAVVEKDGKCGVEDNGRVTASGTAQKSNGVKRNGKGQIVAGSAMIPGGGSKKGVKHTSPATLRQIIDNAIEKASGGNVVEWWAQFVRDYPRDAAKLRGLVEPKELAVTTESRSLIVTIAGDGAKHDLPELIGREYPPQLPADDTQEADVSE